MKLLEEDKKILEELCNQYNVSFYKVMELLETIKKYELKERRTGVYDVIKDILKKDLGK